MVLGESPMRAAESMLHERHLSGLTDGTGVVLLAIALIALFLPGRAVEAPLPRQAMLFTKAVVAPPLERALPVPALAQTVLLSILEPRKALQLVVAYGRDGTVAYPVGTLAAQKLIAAAVALGLGALRATGVRRKVCWGLPRPLQERPLHFLGTFAHALSIEEPLSLRHAVTPLLDSDELRDAMAGKGLGTPATRAAIIEGLLNEKYLIREGR